MQALVPSLPSLKNLPFYAAIDGLTGYLYGKLNQTQPLLTSTIFVIRALADVLFYHIANYLVGGKDLQSQKIFLINSTIVNLIFNVVLRELNLISRFFSCIIGLSVLGQLIHRISYIQKTERDLIAAEKE